MPDRFVDSNVFLYMVQDDKIKAQISRDLLETGCIISVQVLNEIASVLSRKYKMPWSEIRDFLALVSDFARIVPIDHDTHTIGINIAERLAFSIYDSMIIAAALQSGCTTLISEDMQHGQVIDGLVTIVNPFR